MNKIMTKQTFRSAFLQIFISLLVVRKVPEYLTNVDHLHPSSWLATLKIFVDIILSHVTKQEI